MAFNRIFVKEKLVLNSSKNSLAKGGKVIVLGHRVCNGVYREKERERKRECRHTIEFAVEAQGWLESSPREQQGSGTSRETRERT